MATDIPPPTQEMPSEERQFQELLDDCALDKWGFAIYRSSYDDDEAWNACKTLLLDRTHRRISSSDSPGLADSLAWTVFDDAAAFRGASKDQLRQHFKEWAGSAAANEQPRAQEPSLSMHAPRYRYFVQIDQGAMESVVATSDATYETSFDSGYVNVVDAEWRSQADVVAEMRAAGKDMGEADEPFLGYEPIEGCREEDVGWFKLPANRMAPELYGLLAADDSIWSVEYQRPPEIAYGA